MPPEGRILGPILADQLLILRHIIFHRIEVILLQPPIARDEIALGIVLAARDNDERNKNKS